MNNGNGAAMLTRLQPGDLVTVRRPDGGQSTGRARRNIMEDGWNILSTDGLWRTVTAANIIRVQPREINV